MILDLIGFIIGGLVVGGLGRLAVPGRNPMGIGQTILVGMGGSFVGGVIGRLLFGRPGGLILAVMVAAIIVYVLQKRAPVVGRQW